MKVVSAVFDLDKLGLEVGGAAGLDQARVLIDVVGCLVVQRGGYAEVSWVGLHVRAGSGVMAD